MAVLAMKAVLADAPPTGDGWVYETKLDGVRCIATKRRGRVDLRSRNDLAMNGRYPEIVAALEADDADDCVLDGEVVTFDEAGRTSFGRLARRGHEAAALAYVVFDVQRAAGRDVRGLPLLERKALLADLLAFDERLRYSEHVEGNGAELLAQACGQGLEGLIAKRSDSVYTGARSRDWLKLKCSREQELVIGGFTPPKGAREDFGALLVGHYDGGDLRYAGKVGTGFDRATLRELAARLAPLERDSSPFADAPRSRVARWVEPELVAQVAFTEWTRDGRLRHPRFVGLREDKPAREVVREEPG